jgi:hypothetical protein
LNIKYFLWSVNPIIPINTKVDFRSISLNKLTTVKTTVALGALALSLTASASPPHDPNLVRGGNTWYVQYYDDASPSHQQQLPSRRICFQYRDDVGTHMRYYWRDLGFPFHYGMARQEGDQIFMRGDGYYRFPCDNDPACKEISIEWSVSDDLPRGDFPLLPEEDIVHPYFHFQHHDSAIWEIVTDSTRNEGFGHWMAWRENRHYPYPPHIFEGLWTNVKLRRIGNYSRCIPLTEETSAIKKVE